MTPRVEYRLVLDYCSESEDAHNDGTLNAYNYLQSSLGTMPIMETGSVLAFFTVPLLKRKGELISFHWNTVCIQKAY